MDCARRGASASATRAKDRSKDRSKGRSKNRAKDRCKHCCKDRSEDCSEDRSFDRADGGGGRFDVRCVVSIPIAGYRLKSLSVTTITAHLGSHLLVLRRLRSMA